MADSPATAQHADAAEAPAAPARPRVRLHNISKRFGHLLANDDVSLDIRGGEVLGLVGENGAGKTTAMNVLTGVYLPDRGGIEVDGRPLRPGSPRHAVAAGIGMVHQQFKLVETLTGFENISLAVDHGHFLRRHRPDPQLEELMQGLGFEIDLSARVWQMSLSVRQQLEILRTLAIGARVLVLDEPTSVLSPPETVKLFGVVRRIAQSGRAVVFIGHKLLEILDVADRIVVMRGGRVVHDGPSGELALSRLSTLIVGDRDLSRGRRPPGPAGEVLLRVSNLEVHNDLGLPAVRDASFEVHAGELVAVIGVTGNGQIELLDAIGGLRAVAGGHVDAPRDGGGRGFAYIPAQHLGVGLAPRLSIRENAILGRQRSAPFGWWLPRAQVDGHAQRVMSAFSVDSPRDVPVSRLSGGNLQRVVLGRELHGDPRLVVASYPTRGLDVASATQIRRALVERAAAGAAVLLSSEELDESLEIANRVLVMHHGRIVAELDPRALDMDELGQLMTTGKR